MSKENDSASNYDAGLPSDFKEKARQRFEKLTSPDLTFEQHLEHEENEFLRQQALAQDPALKYQPAIGTMTPCGNGDFETALDPAEWRGGYGSLPLASSNPFASFTAGLFPGTGINDFNSHQSWVAAGTDPNVGIPTTAQGSAGAVRIGNNVNGYGCGFYPKPSL